MKPSASYTPKTYGTYWLFIPKDKWWVPVIVSSPPEIDELLVCIPNEKSPDEWWIPLSKVKADNWGPRIPQPEELDKDLDTIFETWWEHEGIYNLSETPTNFDNIKSLCEQAFGFGVHTQITKRSL